MIRSIDDLDLAGKRVLVRVDFNVPLDEDGTNTDDKRIVESLPTIRRIIEKGGRVILMSHLGRPKGERKEKYSLAPVAERLGKLLDREVKLAPDCIGNDVKLMAAIGAFTGWESVLFTLTVSSMLGAIIVVALKLKRLAYVPYIAAAATIWIFFGRDLLHVWLGH